MFYPVFTQLYNERFRPYWTLDTKCMVSFISS